MSDKNYKNYLEQLAQKVLAGNATEEEKLFLEEYYNAFEKHPEIQQTLTPEELQELQASILKNVDAQIQPNNLISPKRFRMGAWRWAAAILFCIVGTVVMMSIFGKKESEPVTKISSEKSLDKIMPGSNKATLTLNNGTTITLDDAESGTLTQQGNIRVTKAKNGQLVYTVLKTELPSKIIEYNTVATPRGGQYQVNLPDGSKVWLNAASSIRFPTSFISSQRNVTITGEVYFEVAHSSRQPFIVSVGETTVEVLGTHFNIMAYNNENIMKTTLLEGAVKITDKDRSGLLQPGQQMQLNASIFNLEKNADVEAELAWRNGLFYFKDADIKAVMRQVERWYNISVKYEGNLPEKQFNGKVPRNVNLSELMEILSFYDDMKCTIDGDVITIKH